MSLARPDHAQYIDEWLSLLRGDSRAVFTAAAKAGEACDWLWARRLELESKMKKRATPTDLPRNEEEDRSTPHEPEEGVVAQMNPRDRVGLACTAFLAAAAAAHKISPDRMEAFKKWYTEEAEAPPETEERAEGMFTAGEWASPEAPKDQATAVSEGPKPERTDQVEKYERNLKLLRELLPEGETHVRIENDPFMPLVVEQVGENEISLCHYGVENGDPMRDPEVVFLVEGGGARPAYFRNDYAHVEHATVPGLFGDVPNKPQLQQGLDSFCRTWWGNIKDQGFFEEAKRLREARPAGEAASEKAHRSSDGGRRAPDALPRTTTSGETEVSVMSEGEKNGPLYSFRSGRVQGSIWDREGPNGETRYTASVFRSYKDKEGNWQQASNFDPEDVPHLEAVFLKMKETLTRELGQNVTEGVTTTQRRTEAQKQSL